MNKLPRQAASGIGSNRSYACFFMLKSSSEAHIGQQRKLVVEELRASEGPTLLGGNFNISRHELLVR